ARRGTFTCWPLRVQKYASEDAGQSLRRRSLLHLLKQWKLQVQATTTTTTKYTTVDSLNLTISALTER
ncbi:unnamed protein product, partial [Heterotrigona itama]